MKSRSAVDIWQAALEELKGKVSPANYNTWLKNTVGLSQQDGSLIVGVPAVKAVSWDPLLHLHPPVDWASEPAPLSSTAGTPSIPS